MNEGTNFKPFQLSSPTTAASDEAPHEGARAST